MYRRIKAGSILICICYDDDRIRCVKSFAWSSYAGMPQEYLMYPQSCEDGLLMWRDSFTYQSREDIVCAFTDTDGEKLSREGILRSVHEGSHEEWFWSNDRGNFGGPLEIELLEFWLKQHPQVLVDSMKENMFADFLVFG